MKFLLTLLLCASIAYGQTIITQPYAFQKYITVKDSSNLQGRLTIPTDTTTNKNGIAQIGTSIYTGNGTYWTLASGGSSSSFNNGGNSFGSTAIIGTKDNNDLKIINNNTNYWTFGKTGTLSNSGVSFDFAGDVTASSSAAITGGAIYPINYLSLPDTNRNVAYNLIGTHNGSLFAQIGSGQYFRQVLMAKDSSLYVTPTQLTAASYTLPQATSSVLGGVKIGSNINVSSGTISLNNSNVIAALGYMPIQLSSLSATRNVSSGSIFSYNNLTGAYNFDTTKLLTLTSISATTPMTFNTSTGVIAIGQSSTSTNGYLSSTDWNTFNGKINLSSLSATRNVSTGSIFTYNSSTGAYNLDTTKYQAPISAGTDITIASNVVSADTTTGATKLATQGYVTRNSGSGGLTGGFTVSSTAAPILFGSVTNSKISGSQSRITIDTSKSVATIILDTAGGSLVTTTTPPSIDFGNSTTTLGNLGKYPKLILEHNSGALSGICTGSGSLGYTAQNSHYWYTGGYNSPTQTMSLDNSGNLQAFSFTATPSYLSKGFEIYESGLIIQLYRSGSFNGINSGIYGVSFANSGTVAGQMFSTGRWYFGASPSDDGVNIAQFNGSIKLETAGNKINIATGTNASIGTATLSSGTVTVSTTAVTSSSKIFVTHAGSSISNAGTLYIGTISANTSFIINSTNSSDNDSINWWIVN